MRDMAREQSVPHCLNGWCSRQRKTEVHTTVNLTSITFALLKRWQFISRANTGYLYPSTLALFTHCSNIRCSRQQKTQAHTTVNWTSITFALLQRWQSISCANTGYLYSSTLALFTHRRIFPLPALTSQLACPIQYSLKGTRPSTPS